MCQRASYCRSLISPISFKTQDDKRDQEIRDDDSEDTGASPKSSDI
jgi:hypothetical protein